MQRREFLAGVSSAAAAAVVGSVARPRRAAAKDLANDRIAIAMVGVKGRGNSVMNTFAALPGVDLKYICDIDDSWLGQRTEEMASKLGRRPQAIKDFRRALDDPSVDAMVLGTPDHWHAIPTILACLAGKDVYVEKPDGHNLIEGRTMVAAMTKHHRVVQLGTQARSSKHLQTAREYILAGHLGRALWARAWESSRQKSLGHPADSQPPAGVDYDMWLGPAPKRPFNPLRFHGNWRWFFDYGTGDLGNDGVHRLDLARWALETAIEARGEPPLGLPRSVSATGGKYYFDDDQQWPDTLIVSYDYPGRVLNYEMRIWSAYPLEGEPEGAAVYGDQGYMLLSSLRWRAFDAKGKPVAEDKEESRADAAHAQNFLDCMRTRRKPAADLETVGHPSSVLCHLGNAAWRAGRTLHFDPAAYTFTGDADANQYLTRPEYRKPWELPKV